MWEAFCHSVFGDKNKGWQKQLRCVYHLCPSNQPNPGTFPPKMKFVQKICPTVYQYRCKHCGCLINNSVSIDEEGRESYKIEPALIGDTPSYRWRW